MFAKRTAGAPTVWSAGTNPHLFPGGPPICVSNFHRSRHAWSADWMFTPDVGGPPRPRARPRQFERAAHRAAVTLRAGGRLGCTASIPSGLICA